MPKNKQGLNESYLKMCRVDILNTLILYNYRIAHFNFLEKLNTNVKGESKLIFFTSLPTTMTKPKYIMLHHSAVSYDRNPDQFEANNNYHKSQWDLKSSLEFYLGYNYEISKSGKLRQARQDGETAVACYQKNMNDGRCIHICIDGHFDNEKPTPEQITTLKKLLQDKIKEHGITREGIVFHRDYARKTCPGMNMDLKIVRDLAGTTKEDLNATPLALMKQKDKPEIYIFGFDNMWHHLGDMDVLEALKGNYNLEEIIKVENLPDNISFHIIKN